MSKKPLIFAFIISLFGHCLFLFIPRFNLISSPLKKWKDVTVEIEIEQIKSKIKNQKSKVQIKNQKLLKKKRQEIKERKKEKSVTPRVPKVGKKPQFRRKKVKKLQATKISSHKVKRQKTVNSQQKTENRKQKTVTNKNKKQGIKEKKESKGKEFFSPVIEEDSEADFVLENGRKEVLFHYQDRIKQKIEDCKRYPRWAKKQGFEGIVYLGFTILSNGETQDIRIVHPSQFDTLNKEALATVNRASPFLPIPQNLNCSFVEMEVSVVFKLK